MRGFECIFCLGGTAAVDFDSVAIKSEVETLSCALSLSLI